VKNVVDAPLPAGSAHAARLQAALFSTAASTFQAVGVDRTAKLIRDHSGVTPWGTGQATVQRCSRHSGATVNPDPCSSQWTTSGDARTDVNGEIRFRGFAGEYDFLMNCLGKDFHARFHAAAAAPDPSGHRSA
jgi:hypothetical protein